MIGVLQSMKGVEEMVARFRADAESLASLRELEALFVAAATSVGVAGFAIGHLQGGDRPTTLFLSTWPRRLLELYAINAFMVDDPVVRGAVVTSDPFEWPDPDLGSSYGNRVLDTFHRFGFASGLAVPVHGPKDARGVVALLARRRPFPMAGRVALIELARSCYLVARRLHDRSAGKTKLSPRERQALSLVAKGFDDGSIATALGVTRTSAHAYVERAKRRVGAKTRAQAVALAIAEDMLD